MVVTIWLFPALRRQRQSGSLWVRSQSRLQREFQNSQQYTEKPSHEKKEIKKRFCIFNFRYTDTEESHNTDLRCLLSSSLHLSETEGAKPHGQNQCFQDWHLRVCLTSRTFILSQTPPGHRDPLHNVPSQYNTTHRDPCLRLKWSRLTQQHWIKLGPLLILGSPVIVQTARRRNLPWEALC